MGDAKEGDGSSCLLERSSRQSPNCCSVENDSSMSREVCLTCKEQRVLNTGNVLWKNLDVSFSISLASVIVFNGSLVSFNCAGIK